MHLRRMLDHAAERYRDMTAIDDQATGESVTYTELRDRVRRVGDGLADGTEPVVGLFGTNGLPLFTAMYGAWDRGLRTCEVKPRTDPGNLSYFVEDGGVDVLVFDAERADAVAQVRAELDVDRYVQVDGEIRDWAEPLDAVMGEPSVPERDVSVDDIASIGYTSGTTGDPKGVPYTFDRMYHTVLVTLLRDEVVHGDTVCLIYPYYGVGTLHLLGSMLVGATVVLPADRDPDTVLATVERESVDSIGGVPTQLKGLAEEAGRGEYDLSSVRYVHTGSGLLTSEVERAVRDAFDPDIFCTSYGSSEAGETCYNLEAGNAIGHPHVFHDVRLVEPGSDDPEAVVEGTGELIVSMDGPTVFDGYWDKPGKTEEAVHDGWYFTGDVVSRDQDGVIRFEGRADDMIISGGENIAPSAAEDVLMEHPLVDAVGVAGVPSERWGEKVVAFVVGDVEPDELDAWCRESDLEDFKRPKEYVFVDEVPTSETGGVRRTVLAERYQEREK